MPGCCHADEYATLFGGREARQQARWFDRVGLRGSEATAAALAAQAGGPDATLLEVGGGLGELQRRGNEFRAFVHPVDAILTRFAGRGLHVVADHAGLAWRTVALEPATGA